MTSGYGNWNRVKTKLFIQRYKSYPYLWNFEHGYYKDRLKRHTALVELAKEFDIDKAEVERKIKNLQSHFLRENKRMIERNSRAAPGIVHQSKWFAYKALTFLLNRGKHCNLDNKPRSLIEVEVEPIEHVVDGVNAPTCSIVDSNKPCVSQVRSRQRAKYKEPLVRAVEALEKVAKLHIKPQSFKNEDEFDFFGQTVAQQLRELPLETALETEELVLSVIRQQRINAAHRALNERGYDVNIEPIILQTKSET